MSRPSAVAGNGNGAAGDREAAVFGRIEAFRRRRPRLRDEVVTLAHGAGGKASAALLDAVFLPAFTPEDEAGHRPAQTDAALVDLPSGDRLAFSTDSYVVKPLRFPGGSAGHLAVHGTINDLAMMGARPLALSAAFVLEEGMAIDVLREVVADMAEAAAGAGVRVVTGDTKVVDRGAADGMYITTAGVGVVPAGRDLAAAKVAVGDVVLVSGTMGDHGTAVMLARGDLALEADIASDTAPLHRMVEEPPRSRTRHPLAARLDPRRRRAPCATSWRATPTSRLSSTNRHSRSSPPSPPPASCWGSTLSTWPTRASWSPWCRPTRRMRPSTPCAPTRSDRHAARVGEIHAEPPGIVVLRTSMGGTRIVDMLVGDPLPRIC